MPLRTLALVLHLSTLAATVPAPGPVTEASRAHAETSVRRGVWPLTPVPRVAARFAPPSVRWASGHRGVDLAGSAGQRVSTALDGTVTHSSPIAGRGVVVVTHADGTRTTYEPVLASVDVGDPVVAGDQIGWLTTAASHCLPAACLHWGWRRGEEYLDPLLLVGRPEIRLFPLRPR